MIVEWHLPDDFEFPDDPSHMWKTDAITFLEFIRERQRSHPEDVFAFHHWLNDAGEVQEPVGEEEEGSAVDEQARANGKQKSHKGKEQARSRAPTGTSSQAEETADEQGQSKGQGRSSKGKERAGSRVTTGISVAVEIPSRSNLEEINPQNKTAQRLESSGETSAEMGAQVLQAGRWSGGSQAPGVWQQ